MKTFREWETFTSFSRAAGVAVDPACIEMLDPSSACPPPPDLKCSIDGSEHFFELGEIIQQEIAWALSRFSSQPIAEPHLPLDTILAPLEAILGKKLTKSYDSEARPISLLLYYNYDPIFWELLRPLVVEKMAEFRVRFESSIFDSIYLFDAANGRVLFDFSQSFAPIIT